jgi:hypothetical protein
MIALYQLDVRPRQGARTSGAPPPQIRTCRVTVSLRRDHPPFRRAVPHSGQGGDPWQRLGLGCAFRSRLPRRGRRSRGAERGRDEATTQARGRTTRLSMPTIRQIPGGDRHTTADRGGRKYGRVRWQCPGFGSRPSVALTQGLRVLLQTDNRRRAARSREAASTGFNPAA